MRDPRRIDRILALLREVWIGDPDFRLAQLVTVAAIRGGWEGGPDVFSAEDELIEAGLREHLQRLEDGV
jgi:uncharacterized protein YihD (DUF1040 family)